MQKPIDEIIENRGRWLKALRSGRYEKGPVPALDDKGRVIDETISGYCACAVLMHEVGGTFAEAKRRVGITAKECQYIQSELSDKLCTFEEVANRIEQEIFA